MTVVLARPILACGAGQLLLLVAASRLEARVETAWFLVLLGLASVIYATAIGLVARGRSTSRGDLVACLVLSVVWRVALAGGAPIASDDVYRYIWDGRVQ